MTSEILKERDRKINEAINESKWYSETTDPKLKAAVDEYSHVITMLFEEFCRFEQVVGKALGRSIIEEELVSEDERDVDQVVIKFANYLSGYAEGLQGQ